MIIQQERLFDDIRNEIELENELRQLLENGKKIMVSLSDINRN